MPSKADLRLDLDFDKAMFRHRLLNWYVSNKAALPWRRDWERYQSPYHVWLSEIMLQQTVIKAVIPVYERFTKELPSIEAVAEASEEQMRRLVRGLGYYRRFDLFKKAARQLTESGEHIEWPRTRQDWLALPGVGAYTSAAISSIAFGEPAAVIDGNVERAFARVFDIALAANDPKLKKSLDPVLNSLIDPEAPGDFNQAIMELGQRVCRPQQPNCADCPISFACRAKERGRQSDVPLPKLKPKTIDVRLRLLFAERNGSYALAQRPAGAKFLKNTLGFVTLIETDSQWQGDGHIAGCQVAKRVLGKVKHSITKHRLAVEVAEVPISALPPSVTWLNRSEIEPKLISNLDRKAWGLITKTLTD